MTSPPARRLELAIGVTVAAVACAFAAGPGWHGAADVAAARLGRPLAASPGYGAVAALAQLVPIGEAGVRVALISALAAGVLAAAVVAMARALVPREVGAGIGAIAALALVASTRIAATTPGPAMMAAAAVAWTAVGLIRIRRGDGVDAAGPGTAIAGLAFTLAAAPWIGLALALIVVPVVWSRRRALVIVPVLVAVPLVIVAGLPPIANGIGDRVRAVIGALGADAGVVVFGAGALGLGFAVVTGLRGAAIALVALIAVAVGGVLSPIGPADAALAVHAILAIGIAVLGAAGVRLVLRSEPSPAPRSGSTSAPVSDRRAGFAAALSLPFAAVALTTATAIPDDGDAPARVAADLADPAPAGPGAIFVGGEAIVALHHERVVAGLRPDLGLRARAGTADRLAVAMLRQDRVVVADQPEFGALDDRRARPRGRGFELLLVEGASDTVPPAPARYRGAIGGSIATRLALARALWEAGASRLDHAARAAGLVGTRFDAATVAVLAATLPRIARPALFGFVPDLGTTDPRARIDLFGDDLAWVGAIAEPPLPADASPERRLHARWRAVLTGIAPPTDPAIRELGPAAVAATREMLAATGREEAANKLSP